MRFEDYTLDQQKAIISKGSNIIVSAGAGSGKTQVLTARVLHFIKNENYKLSNFLILTFTNLAAGEMKKRIRDNLINEGLEEANEVDNADICTFDSYALSIVKKYHFILNVSNNISIIDSNIIAVKKRNIIKNIFEEYYASNEIFKKMISSFCFKDDDSIQKLVLDFYNNALLELDTDEYLNTFVDKYYNETFFEKIYLEIEQKLNALKEDLIPYLYNLPDAKISKKEDKSYQSTVLDGFEEFINSSTYEKLITSIPDLKTYKITKPRNLLDEEKKAIDDYKEKFEEVYEYIVSLPKTKQELFLLLSENKEYASLMIEIIKKLDQEIVEYKNKYQVFEFQDIAKKALFLVKTNQEVRNSIKNKLKMIMIDEYQDTSALQEAFINQIENNNVYMVGDVKQSIYRFRNARSDIFIDKYNRYKENKGGIAIDLNKNFRSRREVLDDINYIFKQLMSEKAGGASYIKDHMIEYGNKAYINAGKIDDKLNSSFILYEKDHLGIEKEAHLIARDIISKINNHYRIMCFINKKPVLRDCELDDFCILMDRGTNFELFARVFNEYKIPLFIENDENISTNEIVLILTNLLRLIKAIQNNDYSSKEFIKAFLSVSRSFLFEYSDSKLLDICKQKDFYNEEIIVKIRNVIFECNDLPFYAMLEKLLFSLDCYHKLILIGDVKKNEKYLDMFLELFKSMSNLDYSLDDFISYLEQVDDYNLKITLSSEGTSLKSVRIMNIHKSKGLEFNICYFAGLSTKFNRNDVKSNMGISSQYGLYLPDNDILKTLNRDYEIKEDISEKIRLFYVALTRAREKMIFIMQVDNVEECLKTEQKETSLKTIILRVEDNYLKEKIDYSLFEKIISLSGYQIKVDFNKKIDNEFIFKIRSLTFDDKYIGNGTTYQELLHRILNMYYENQISFNELKQIAFSFDLDLNCGFSSLNIDEQKIFSDVSNTFAEKGQIIDPLKMSSFYDFIQPFMNYSFFEKYTYDLSLDKPIISLKPSMVTMKNLTLKEVKVESKIIETFKSSKDLMINSSKQAMEFGTDIHFVMEIMDFKNPDYNMLNNSLYKYVVKKFLSSPIMEKVKEGKIYKEYEFYDEENLTSGVIDLMIIYDDYIDVIDYKTKHIDDEDYDKQVLIYKKYVEKSFNKKVNAFLYSLMDGTYKRVL